MKTIDEIFHTALVDKRLESATVPGPTSQRVAWLYVQQNAQRRLKKGLFLHSFGSDLLEPVLEFSSLPSTERM